MALEDPEGDSEGFILEKTVKETLEDLKVAALALLKLGQVDPNADGESPGDADAEKGGDNAAEEASAS